MARARRASDRSGDTDVAEAAKAAAPPGGRRGGTKVARAEAAVPSATAAKGEAVAGAERPQSAKTVATPWGAARLLDELSLPQEAGERTFASLVQLLEAADGERLVRFAYATDGVARRGPVTLRRSDLTRLRRELTTHEELRDALDA